LLRNFQFEEYVGYQLNRNGLTKNKQLQNSES
jgi:hypothetical protein